MVMLCFPTFFFQIYQYAHCVKDRLGAVNMTDVAIYVDVWRSLNGRFQQRLIDPRVNLLEAEWSPFRPTPWLMPLLTELSAWRQKLNQLERTVFDWSDSSRVAFVADFPGEFSIEICFYQNLF
jgi:vitamin K-dependent gamma-carboxylase